MDGPTVGLIGGIFGGTVGTLGGIIGTYAGIKSAKGPLERAFIIRTAVKAWVEVLVLLGLLFALPKPYNWLVWIPHGIWMLIITRKWRTKHIEIRQLESGDKTFTSRL